MEEVVASIIFATIVILIFSTAFVTWVREKPEEYEDVCKAIATALFTPMLIYRNLKHNSAAHKNGLRKIKALSDADTVEETIKELRREVLERATQIQTVEELRAMTDEEILGLPINPVNKKIRQ